MIRITHAEANQQEKSTIFSKKVFAISKSKVKHNEKQKRKYLKRTPLP